MKQQNTTKRKNQNAGLHFIAIVLVAITIISSSIGLFAWSKYTSFLTNSATASIAKWSFDLKLKNGPKAGSAEETTGPIDLAETIDFTHVKSGTIAPGTNGEFQVIVNTGDTEVDCFYEVTIGLTNCPRNITFSRVDESNTTTVLSAGGASNTNSRTLYFSKYLQAKKVDGNTTTNENGKHIETITWNWPYELTTGSDEAKAQWDDRDKEDMGLTISMTITAKGTEVLKDPNSVTVSIGGSNVNITKANVSSYIGQQVDYTDNDANTNLTYRLFYIDFDNKYGDGKGAVYLKADYDSNLKRKLSDFNSTYTPASDTKVEVMNPVWAAQRGKAKIGENGTWNNNEKSAAYLCDPAVWTPTYYTGEAGKGYAIGSPSVDMYMDAMTQAGYTAIGFDYFSSNVPGYKFMNGGSYNWYSASNSIPNTTMFKGSGYWWLASPSASNANFVCFVRGDDGSVYLNTCGTSSGVCPLVCLKSGI